MEVASSGGANSLDGLNDVTIVAPQNDDLLQYNNVSGQWINQPISGLSVDFDNINTNTVTGKVTDLVLRSNDLNHKITVDQVGSQIVIQTPKVLLPAISNGVLELQPGKLTMNVGGSAYSLPVAISSDKMVMKIDATSQQMVFNNLYSAFCSTGMDPAITSYTVNLNTLNNWAAIAQNGLSPFIDSMVHTPFGVDVGTSVGTYEINSTLSFSYPVNATILMRLRSNTGAASGITSKIDVLGNVMYNISLSDIIVAGANQLLWIELSIINGTDSLASTIHNWSYVAKLIL